MIRIVQKESHDQGLEQDLKEAKEAFEKAQTEYNTQASNAFTNWSKDPISGSPAGTALQSWIAANAPGLLLAQTERDTRAQRVAQVLQKIFGPDGAILTQQKNACIQADNKLVPATGCVSRMQTLRFSQ